MNAMKTGILGIVFGSFLLQPLQAQRVEVGNVGGDAAEKNQSHIPKAFQGFRIPPSAPLRFLASEEGRSFLKASGHPLAQYAIQAFGEPSQAAVASAARLRQAATGPWRTVSGRTVSERFEEAVPGTPVPCSGNSGARFNLEPRANALPQNQANADFLPNRIAAGNDLIVQAANDYRGNLTHGPWDQNVSGYYVHRSTAADCSVQFEGGLPSFTFQGNSELGIGNVVVAADPARDAIFMADVRFANTGGVGLFRASAATLLNTTACPNGTHSQAQAASCWSTTPPSLLFTQAGFDSINDLPSIAVDERPSGGTGAGNVYVASTQFSFAQQASTIALAACTNVLDCSKALTVSGSDTSSGFPDVRVRPDGQITISYLVGNSDRSETIKFVTCTPVVAPKMPTCGPPILVQNIAHSIAPSVGSSVQTELVNINLITFTYPKHTHRAESGNAFSTFLVYDNCRHPFQQGNPSFTQCLDAEVLMTVSTDNGKTWSAPVSVDATAGHHFYPAIATDASTGFVNIAYYSTEGDKFNHNVRVLLNQIAPGTTKIGPAKFMTTLTPIDSDPGNTGLLQFEMFIGVVSRGTSSGRSKAYTSFHTNTVSGTYGGRPLPEENNHISAFVF